MIKRNNFYNDFVKQNTYFIKEYKENQKNINALIRIVGDNFPTHDKENLLTDFNDVGKKSVSFLRYYNDIRKEAIKYLKKYYYNYESTTLEIKKEYFETFEDQYTQIAKLLCKGENIVFLYFFDGNMFVSPEGKNIYYSLVKSYLEKYPQDTENIKWSNFTKQEQSEIIYSTLKSAKEKNIDVTDFIITTLKDTDYNPQSNNIVHHKPTEAPIDLGKQLLKEIKRVNLLLGRNKLETDTQPDEENDIY